MNQTALVNAYKKINLQPMMMILKFPMPLMKLMLFEDGSVASEAECGDPELEEERSASAIAANQTMTMITRRQEEKAAMQMEALQCQRMMEEQSEYDPEALQILNDLMMKREKEKQELEMELEEHRKKILDYEGKEKLRVLRRKDGIVRTKDEDNGIFNHEESSHNNLSADTVSNLEEMAIDCAKYISVVDNSLAEFEEDKVSILDEFKALREKLIAVVI
ncbi:myosin-binding protein 3-like [Gastrolobium bilobum]|uniref:myosin-binding protein 3-like n=1 Tax=Gastrolobium bilobum TaxID=150636 RepID=UPI002AB02CE7|nr:myosin-binding protein 3-like [Gastrolobium bilobum]XP_061350539.1 myosin-binding protein 3-like [Gastrolobium bilobum]